MELNRKLCGFKTEVNRKERLVTGFISTTRVDQEGDVVMPGGMALDPYFDENRGVNFNHNRTAVIGKNRNLSIRNEGVYASTFIGTHALGEDVLTMVEEGLCKWHSIEWDPERLVAGPPTPAETARYPGVKRVFRSWVLTGYALTPIPCNLGAAIDGVKELQPIYDQLESLFKSGKIHRSSAVAAGFPDAAARKVWPVRESPKKRVVFAGGVVWRR